MGDVRFAEHYQRLRESRDIVAAMRSLSDSEIIAALAAASRERDPYFANVLATEAQNRVGQKEAVVSTLAEGVYAVDVEGRLMFLNPAAERMLGWSLEELKGRSTHEMLHDHGPDADPGGECPLLRRLLERRQAQEGEQLFRRRDGRRFPTSFSAAPILRDGDITGVAVVFRDIMHVKRAERRRAVRYAIADILAETGTFREAAPRVLEAFGGELGWLVGDAWEVDRESASLRCVATWHRPGANVQLFEEATKHLKLRRGEGLPGRAWAQDRAVWLEDLTAATNFPRSAEARVSGIHAGFAFPVTRPRGEAIGVISFFSAESQEPDVELLDLASTVADQLASFVERKEAERLLTESEGMKRAILESALDVIITMDHCGKVQDWNPAAERLFGVPRAEAQGQDLADLIIPPRLREAHHRGLRRYLETGDGPVLGQRLEMPAWRSDGTEFPVELAIVPIRGGAEPMFTGYLRDLTEQRRSEDALRQLAALVDASTEAITLFGPDGTVRAWNHGAERLYGYKADELVGKSIITLTPPERSEESKAILARVLAGERVQDFETQRLTKDGRVIDVALSVAPILDAEGNVAAASGISRDISRRKGLERALVASEQRYRMLYEGTPSMYFVVDEQGTILAVNERGARQLGYEPRELEGKPVLEVFHPDDRKDARGRLSLAFEHPAEPRHWKSRKVRKDGTHFWVRESTLVVDEGSRHVALILCDDISADEDELERTRAIAQRYRSLFEHSPDGLFALDLEGRYTAVNASAQQIGGYDVAEMLGRPFTEIVMPEDRERAWSHFEAAKRGEPRRYELAIRRKDGQIARIEAAKIPIYDDGQIVGVHGVCTDLTKRKRAESLLAGQTRILERIAKSAPLTEVLTLLCRFIEEHSEGVRASILLLDEDKRHLRLGAAPNLPQAYNDAIDGVEIGPNVGSCGTAAFQGEPVVVPDIREDPKWDHFRDPALRHGLVSCWSSPILSSSGDVLGTFAMYHATPRWPGPYDQELQSIASRLAGIAIERERADRERAHDDAEITELNLRLQHVNEELERRVRERTQELAATNRELESFSYTVSHDLRAPLRGITQYAQALEEDYAGKLDDDGRQALRRIQEESRRLSGLIQELLQLSKVARGPLERTRVDLTSLAQSVAADLRRRDPTRAARFEIDEGLAAEGEPALLRAVLENLMGNAWKFTAGKPEAHIEVRAEREGPETVFFVRDNGAGFDMAKADRLFKPFQRLHTREQYEGTGIGLATVQRIIQRHGGRIWAEGRTGRGATFYFTLGGAA